MKFKKNLLITFRITGHLRSQMPNSDMLKNNKTKMKSTSL